jgi:hypothetical protein
MYRFHHAAECRPQSGRIDISRPDIPSSGKQFFRNFHAHISQRAADKDATCH